MARKPADRSEILSKIKKLKALADDESASPNERMMALSHMRSLSDRYSISNEEIESATAEKVFIQISFNKTYTVKWVSNLCSILAQFYKCFCAGVADPDGKKVYGAILSGDKLDVEIAEKAIEIILPQLLDLSDKLYDWACETYNGQNEKIKSPTFVVSTTSSGMMTVSSSAFYSNFLSYYSNFDSIAHQLRHVLKNESKMPDRDSDLWGKLEDDWGLGAIISIMRKLESGREEADNSYNNEYGNASNALTVQSNIVASNKVREAESALIEKLKLADQSVQRQPRQEVNYQFMLDKGLEDGVNVETESKG